MPAKRKPKSSSAKKTVTGGAVASEKLVQEFPDIDLPIRPPYPPAEAKSVEEIPSGPEWIYEPKWDGFRCLAFRKGNQVLLQSKAGQPLGRYFPELVEAVSALPEKQFVLDGEIVIFVDGHLSFDDLLMRIHPADSRIRKLSKETPVTFMSFDLLIDETGKSLIEHPLSERKERLERFFENLPEKGMVRLSPASRDRAQADNWMGHLTPIGLDGVVAKLLEVPYASGERTSMVKIKRLRTADCVVGGFRYAEKGGGIGSLLLGLYNAEGNLDHVGFSSSFTAEQRLELKKIVEPLIKEPGFTGKAPGGPSRWSTRRTDEWKPLKPELVCEVRYDHFSGGRFRHGTKFLRWRPDKKAQQCTIDQVLPKRGKQPGLELSA
jgi:ATP-dependent DNA ligase